MAKRIASVRTRNWTGLLYPDSAYEDWRERLGEQIPWIESPLHDKDVEPDGEPKKEHYHVVFAFEGVKTYEQVYEIFCKAYPEGKAPKRIEPVHSMHSMVRYLCHLDEDETKYKYNQSDIICHGGADVAALVLPTRMERYALVKEMVEFIDKEDITSYMVMFKYAAKHRYEDWFPLICDSYTYVIKACIADKYKEIYGNSEGGENNESK